MERVSRLYMRDGKRIHEPLPLGEIAKLQAAGRIPPHAEFSVDKRKWFAYKELNKLIATSATSGKSTNDGNSEPGESEEIAELLPKTIKAGADVNELKRILKRARRAARRMAWMFIPLLAGCFASSCAVFSVVSTLAVGRFLPQISSEMQILLVFLPAALLAAAVTHLAGNWITRLLSGLNQSERHAVALHLPWSRAPKEWPKSFRRWIYCGDWLIENFSADLTPYIRAFVTGAPVRGIDQELTIWSELMQATSRADREINWEAGHSVRELAKVDALPAWVRDITPGMGLPEMERALGEAGHAWAVNLLKRAAMRKRSFGHIDFSGDLHEATFEFHYCNLPDEREGLLVVIRPHGEGGVILFDTVSDNLAA